MGGFCFQIYRLAFYYDKFSKIDLILISQFQCQFDAIIGNISCLQKIFCRFTKNHSQYFHHAHTHLNYLKMMANRWAQHFWDAVCKFYRAKSVDDKSTHTANILQCACECMKGMQKMPHFDYIFYRFLDIDCKNNAIRYSRTYWLAA